jgi:hypothetical protein
MKAWLSMAALALLGFCGTAEAAKMVLVEKGVSLAPIMVAADAPYRTVQAANELADYIGKISGARPVVRVGESDPMPTNAIWVGLQPKLAGLFPDVKLDFQYPEEILFACNGQHLVIVGRDRMSGTNQTEFGTANAVYTFLEKRLDVRWLWPGPLGEDIVKRDTIALAPFEYRFHPLFRKRKLWPEVPNEWFIHQRLKLFSFQARGGHAFTPWWDKYGTNHPDYFALQPDGKRGAFPKPVDAKLCLSNPGVWSQWLDNAEAAFRADPDEITFSATPNDGPGECVCTNCRAWDNPKGSPVKIYGRGGATDSPSLTDRHVKFWNILARGLRERFPDREVYVGAAAYATYRSPPVAEMLERNIIIAYAGHFPLANDTVTKQEQDAWLAWSDKASAILFRPNLFHYSGGWLGLPTVATRRTMKDFHFLAENKCVGLEVDTLPHSWAAQGPQFYLMAQLAYDPLQDGKAVMKDYYRRAFGPAAGDVERYFALMEQVHEAILDRIKHSGAFAKEAIAIFQDVYTDDVLNRAETLLQNAAVGTADGPEIYRQRVAFTRAGYDFTKVQVQIMREMKKVRESKGADRVAVRKATELCDAREALFKQHEGIALKRARWYHDSRRLDDYMGPPSAVFRAVTNAAPSAVPDFEGRD